MSMRLTYRANSNGNLEETDTIDNNEEVDLYQMLLTVIRSLVDQPTEVEIVTIRMEQRIIFRIQADPNDVGKLIGNGGQTARAIRTILRANAMRLKRSFGIDIVDTKARKSQHRLP